VKFAFIDAEKAWFPVEFMCRQLAVSRSGFYAWQARGPSAHAITDAVLGREVEEAHVESRRTYGSPRVHAQLKAEGRRTSRKRVARLMREKGLVARRKKRGRRTTDSKHGLPVAPNLLERDFTVEAPNRVWVTDITYVWTREGWLYLSAIVDLFARVVVGWAMSENIDTQMCLAALSMAVARRNPPAGLVHHSDRGCQYASHDYRKALAERGIQCSMSRKGDCWDNAVAESFWSTLKTELIEGRDFATRAQARQAIFEFIEVFYNRKRIHSSCGYQTPVDKEMIAFQTAVAA